MFTEQYLALAKTSTLLHMFSVAELEGFIKEGTFRTVAFSKGSIIHLEGELCGNLEIILSGKIAVERISETGELLPIASFTTNDLLGGGLLFSHKPYYPMTISAKQDSVILQIPKNALFRILSTNPTFLLAYLELTSDRTSVLTDKIKNHLNTPLRERIMNFLDHQSLLQQAKCIELPMTKTILALQIGVQRTSLSRELKKMQDEGLITFDAHSITVLY